MGIIKNHLVASIESSVSALPLHNRQGEHKGKVYSVENTGNVVEVSAIGQLVLGRSTTKISLFKSAPDSAIENIRARYSGEITGVGDLPFSYDIEGSLASQGFFQLRHIAATVRHAAKAINECSTSTD